MINEGRSGAFVFHSREGSADVAFRTHRHLMRNQSFWVRGEYGRKVKLKGIDGRAPPGVELRLNLTQHGETYRGPDIVRIDGRELFLDSMGGGAWPFLVGGAICLVNSVNERDLGLLTSYVEVTSTAGFLEGLWPFRPRKFEAIAVRDALRDVTGRARATAMYSTSY
ncbi:hypothetical protein Syun_031928 [Stephania yunnanensis]|uniref:Uncharacterized protein n=1 Tax=Stephania yunnanensis TaxID=152371 RepID=A0AAP0HA99_9MAGN